jgi:serine/threonine-protein kinase
MKLCATCQNKYPDDANFCPRAECAGPNGPQRLLPIEDAPAPEAPPPRYQPVSKLGGGASGEVWQATDSQTGTAVAYKVVAPQVLPTPVSVDRTLRELRQLQRAGSSRIVKVLDFGKTPDGRVFIASELTEGEPLDQVMARTGPFDLERAKRVVAQIGEALLDAQKVGVVHRDLSAKNVLVSRDDEARLINFAVPRPLTETLFGVPEFMSPEQAEGKLIDQRSNTYSLGALVYLMLTGQPPYVGATPQATIEALLKAEITPPSIRRGGGLTTEVDRVLLKALERNSSRRPLTMRQFLSDVAALIVPDQQAPVASAGAGGREAAFAKTIMFAGGAPEVQKLVAQAVAARQAAEGPPLVADASAAPAGEPGASRAATPTPSGAARQTAGRGATTPSPSAGRPSHGAAVAATMISMPITGAISVAGPPAGTPRNTETLPPVALTPGQAAGSFRETLWFKKGDVDQMVADARAKVQAMVDAKNAAAAPEAVVAPAADVSIPPTTISPDDPNALAERYTDDGTLTVADHKKFSLGSTGRSGRVAAARGEGVPGERMSDDEVLDEIGGGKRLAIIGISVAVVVALIGVGVMALRGKGHPAPSPAATAPATVPAPEKPPAPAEPAKAAPTPAVPAEAPEAEAAPVAPKPVVKHHPVAKKKPAPPKAAPAKKHR